MAERESKAKRTDKVIVVEKKFPPAKECGNPNCEECKNLKPSYRQHYGDWVGEPGKRPQRKEDQVLEIVVGYSPGDTACRDYTVLLTYGQIMEGGISRALKVAERAEWYSEEHYRQIVEWFVEVVERTWKPPIPKRILEAEYLAQYIRQEALQRGSGIVDVFNTKKMKELIEAGIIEYEQSMFNREKGITNEDKKET